MQPIQGMTAELIRVRLVQLGREEARHQARDFDRELADTLRAGGDVDALEAAQLEAERVARRLRVERSALEAELPVAMAREGSASIAALVSQQAELAPAAIVARDRMVKAWAEYVDAVTGWGMLQDQVEQIAQQASTIAAASKTDLPQELGKFQSRQIDALLDDYHRQEGFVLPRLATAQHSTQTGRGLRSVRLD